MVEPQGSEVTLPVVVPSCGISLVDDNQQAATGGNKDAAITDAAITQLPQHHPSCRSEHKTPSEPMPNPSLS